MPKVLCDSGDIQYTTYLTKSIKGSKYNTLNFMQYNMNNFSNLFEKKLNNKLFNKELKETSNGQCISTILNILHTIEEGSIKADESKKYFIYQINNLDFKKDIYDKNVAAIEVNNIKSVSDNLSYLSQEDLQTEDSTFYDLKTEGSTITQTSNESEYTHSVNQDNFYDYLQHIGFWSSEYLNVCPIKSEQKILSIIVREVLNFEYGISEIRYIKIRKSNIAGVIDVIENTKVVEIIKSNLENKEILCFTVDDAVSACLNAYKDEMKISLKKGELYQVFDYAPMTTRKTNNKQKENQDMEDGGIYLKIKILN